MSVSRLNDGSWKSARHLRPCTSEFLALSASGGTATTTSLSSGVGRLQVELKSFLTDVGLLGICVAEIGPHMTFGNSGSRLSFSRCKKHHFNPSGEPHTETQPSSGPCPESFLKCNLLPHNSNSSTLARAESPSCMECESASLRSCTGTLLRAPMSSSTIQTFDGASDTGCSDDSAARPRLDILSSSTSSSDGTFHAAPRPTCQFMCFCIGFLSFATLSSCNCGTRATCSCPSSEARKSHSSCSTSCVSCSSSTFCPFSAGCISLVTLLSCSSGTCATSLRLFSEPSNWQSTTRSIVSCSMSSIFSTSGSDALSALPSTLCSTSSASFFAVSSPCSDSGSFTSCSYSCVTVSSSTSCLFSPDCVSFSESARS
mmetsp:Transcript_81840/g.175328  ORF Transcript_81840/g.175328 Transcript_81840/m.175328 type:complete len:372 (-) Transcript_81840:1338-2453(-)